MPVKTAYQGELSFLEKQILHHVDEIEQWFRFAWQKTPAPLMSSVDLRNAGFKLCPVDTNLFPAGFNNLNPQFMPLCIQALQSAMHLIHPTCRFVLIIPEAHTRNVYYFQSLNVLITIFKKAGFTVKVGHWAQQGEFEGVKVELITRVDDTLMVGDKEPCLVVLNNDLSEGIPPILKNLAQQTLPATKMGWVNRRKSLHFKYFKQVAKEFLPLINCSLDLIYPEMENVKDVDFMGQVGIEELAAKTEKLLTKIKSQYAKKRLDKKPFVVIKPDNGTYGMGIMSVSDSNALLNLNRKQRTKLSAIKGGASVHNVLVQEGVYTAEFMENGASAEPVIYMIGQHVVGGFYRVHKSRGVDDNLNAPGMHFEPLAFEEACNIPNCDNFEESTANRFYVYGVIARLCALAAGLEEQELLEEQ
ncbi:MAG: glutamate--cysteine ligase [Legionellales bacterium RIFCSPHIGHO2_12_FULL_37_14]|nr:MAG: glutamate--cysteine ligase [Legionellales bacterium RIFCSPHIGHO2_12_FULL_37_14]